MTRAALLARRGCDSAPERSRPEAARPDTLRRPQALFTDLATLAAGFPGGGRATVARARPRVNQGSASLSRARFRFTLARATARGLPSISYRKQRILTLHTRADVHSGGTRD